MDDGTLRGVLGAVLGVIVIIALCGTYAPTLLAGDITEDTVRVTMACDTPSDDGAFRAKCRAAISTILYYWPRRKSLPSWKASELKKALSIRCSQTTQEADVHKCVEFWSHQGWK